MDEDTMEYYHNSHNLGVRPRFFFLVIRYVKKLIGLLYENADGKELKIKRGLDKKLRELEKHEKEYENDMINEWMKLDEPEDIIRALNDQFRKSHTKEKKKQGQTESKIVSID